MKKPIVVLLHGVWRTSFSMSLLGHALKKAGFQIINRSYSWHSARLAGIARELRKRLRSYDDREVFFVTHSYGGLVARFYLGRYQPANVRRLVMIAPPSKGSCIALFHKNSELLAPLFRLAYGRSAMNLTPAAVDRIPRPTCEFAIIAGGTGKKKGYAPFLPGDNDGVVCVDEARLRGAKQFAIVPHRHTFIMNGRDTVRMTVNFLKTGKFAGKKKPS